MIFLRLQQNLDGCKAIHANNSNYVETGIHEGQIKPKLGLKAHAKRKKLEPSMLEL
jgi:hypothetical protein